MGNEIQAMSVIGEAMKDLDVDESKRVLRWAVDKYGQGEVSAEPGADGARSDAGSGAAAPERFTRLVDLVDAASPVTTADYVLVASYWFQVVKGQESFGGQEVNSQLKDLGHGLTHITDGYDSLKTRKPPAVRQMQKSGSTRQARKRYRLTEVGIRTVERMLSGEIGE